MNQLNKKKNITPRLISAALAAFIAQPSLAQTSEAQVSTGMLEEILVTAQKRAFSAQLTPVALTAATGDTLRENGVASALDLNGLSPSLSVASSNGQLQLTMRGVGNEILLSGVGEAGVAMHSNGVYLGSNVTATAMFFDIERIEVMRGPQGTLWGRNSTGGAINVIQKKPTEEFEGFAAIDYGNYNSIDLEAAVSGSLTDSVQGRIAVKHGKSDGFLKNLAPGGDDMGDDNSISVRASINVDLDRGSWLLAAGHSDWDIAGRSVKQEGTSFPSGSPTVFGLPGGLAFSEIAYGQAAPAGKFETYSTNPNAGEEADLEYFTSELSLELDSANLTVLTDYRQHERSYRVDGDFTP
jgi:iron complex outermembrane receptor protein